MSHILNIETSTTNCSVSLSFENDLIDCIEQDSLNYSHSENLHVFIKELLNKNNTEFNQLSAISVSRGPGSYTGLRIGLSAAKGLCYGLDIPLISISSLKILANSLKFKGFIVSTMDARRDEVYSCRYDTYLNVIREEKPEIINHKSFIDISKNNKLLFIGDGQFKCKELINTNDNLSFESSILRPTSKNMIDLAFDKLNNSDIEDLAYFEPIYLK